MKWAWWESAGWYEKDWGFWFRVKGYGLHITNAPPLFSERRGLRICVRILGVKIEVLTP